MEKQTRINKYKELRDEMKEEVAIDRHAAFDSNDEDDDFLSFLPQNREKEIDDTLMEPLSYETLKQDNEEVKSALNEVKVNVGKEQYNTRLDILNKIKQTEEHVPQHAATSLEETEVKKTQSSPQKKMSLLEKLAAMSPEEDAEELKKYEEDLTVADFMKDEKKKKNRVEKENVSQHETLKPQKAMQKENEENEDEFFDDEEEEESKLVTVLNYVIIVFIVVFIVLAFFIVKQLLF